MKKIIVLPLLILAILVNMIPMSSGASASEMTTNDRIAFYVSCIRNHYAVVNRNDTENYIAFLYGSYYMQVLFYDENDSIIYENGLYFGDSDRIGIYVNGYPFETYESNNVTHIHGINSYFTVSESKRYNLPENIDYILTNDADMVLALKNEYEWKNDNVIGGLPLQESELDVSWFQSFNSDIINHVFTFENLSDRDIYFTLMLYNSSKEKVYQYFHKQLFGGSYNSLIYYMNLQSLDDDQKIVWLSKFFSDSKFFGLEHSNEDCPRKTYEEIHSFLSMDEMQFLIKEHDIIVNGNLFPVYKAVFDTNDRDYSMLNFDWNKDKTIDYVNRNGVGDEAAYEVELRFNDQDYYEYDPIVKISPGESIRILVPESDLQIYPGDYQWVIGYNLDDSFNMDIHSTIAFHQEAATVYDPSDDQVNGSGGFIVDGNGDKVGAHDFNGSFVLENEFEQTISDMSELDASNIKKLWESSSGYLSFFGDTLGIIPGWQWTLVSSIIGLFIVVFVLGLLLGKR